MIELTVLQHDFDEERGFGEPPRQEARPISWPERLSVALVALGLLVFLLSVLAGVGRGSWPALLGSLGAMSLGTAGTFFFRYRGTTPGIRHDDTMFTSTQARGWIGWGLGIFITAFYVILYWYADLQTRGMPPVFDTTIELVSPLAMMLTGNPADQWFLYGLLYTLCILAFGVRMLMKYRHNRYHLIRTVSVMFFQLGFAFILPGLLKKLNEPEFYPTYFWPLKPEYGEPGGTSYIIGSGGSVGWIMIGFGIMMTVIATPVLTYFFGKRWYCSWVCGCGGLAETLGDPWRQLSSKSTIAWKIERVLIYTVLGLVILSTAFLWSRAPWAGDFRRFYGFMVVNMFAGVIGVGFYPLMGSRVWCRFGCPMAAILGILQRWFSRFRITTNGSQCMSCGNCSTYCEMGIDVRAYAQRGENIVRASCVGCGVCAAVCPRGVLKLENGTVGGRYPEAGGPLDRVISDLGSADTRRGA